MISPENTLAFYNKNSVKYFDQTIHIDIAHAYRHIQERLPVGSRILDLGAGSGRDSRYFLDQGYDVTSVDGSANLADVAQKRLGISIQVLDFEEIDFKYEFDAVWASCCLMHNDAAKLRRVLKKIGKSLKPGGYFYASYKFGEDSFVDETGRFFLFQNFPSLVSLYEEFSEFSLVLLEKTDSRRKDSLVQWMHVLVQVS